MALARQFKVMDKEIDPNRSPQRVGAYRLKFDLDVFDVRGRGCLIRSGNRNEGFSPCCDLGGLSNCPLLTVEWTYIYVHVNNSSYIVR